MATLSVTTVSRAGVDVVGVEPGADGDEFANTGVEFVEIHNGSGSGITVTLDLKATLDGQAAADPTVAIAAGVTKIIGPFPSALYNDSSTGRAKVTCSAQTDVTIKALKCPAA